MKGLHHFNYLVCSLVGNHRFDTPTDHLVFPSSEQTSQSFPLLSFFAVTILGPGPSPAPLQWAFPFISPSPSFSQTVCFADQTPLLFFVQPPPWLLPNLRMKPGDEAQGTGLPGDLPVLGSAALTPGIYVSWTVLGWEAVGLRVINGSCSQPEGSACTKPRHHHVISRSMRCALALLQTNLRGEWLRFHVYEWNLEETAKPPQVWRDPFSHDHLQLCTPRMGIWWPEASTARCL